MVGEGGELRATTRRAPARTHSLWIAAALVAATVVLSGPAPAGAASYAPRRMPNVVGLPRSEVFDEMRAAQLYFTTRGPGSGSTVWRSAAGQSPRAGTLVAWHDTVRVVTSLRPGHALRAMPRLVGLSRSRVYAAMRAAQLYFTTRGPGSTTGTWVTVVRQSVRPGTAVHWHSSVVVVTSLSPPAPPKPSRAGDYRIGIATWYSYIPGHCATSYLPYGIHLHVRDLATGRVIVCVVTDREADRGNDRVVDLSETQFAELAPLPQGVIRVKVWW